MREERHRSRWWGWNTAYTSGELQQLHDLYIDCEVIGCAVMIVQVKKMSRKQIYMGYIEFAWLESSADAIHSATFNLAVAMSAEIHCHRPPMGAQWLHICPMPIVE